MHELRIKYMNSLEHFFCVIVQFVLVKSPKLVSR